MVHKATLEHVVEALTTAIDRKWWSYDGAFKKCIFCGSQVDSGAGLDSMLHQPTCLQAVLQQARELLKTPTPTTPRRNQVCALLGVSAEAMVEGKSAPVSLRDIDLVARHIDTLEAAIEVVAAKSKLARRDFETVTAFLAKNDHVVVSTARLSPLLVAAAKAGGDMYVTPNHLGYVRLHDPHYKGVPSKDDKAYAQLEALAEERKRYIADLEKHIDELRPRGDRERTERHTHMTHWSPIEHAIAGIHAGVEALGAHPRLTRAGALLVEARESIADWAVDTQTTTATPAPRLVLDPEGDGEADYQLTGNYAWVSADNATVCIHRKENNMIKVDVYRRGDEDDEPLARTWAQVPPKETPPNE